MQTKVPLFEFIYLIDGQREVSIIAESKYAAKNKLSRMEGIHADTQRALIDQRPYVPKKNHVA